MLTEAYKGRLVSFSWVDWSGRGGVLRRTVSVLRGTGRAPVKRRRTRILFTREKRRGTTRELTNRDQEISVRPLVATGLARAPKRHR